MHHHGRGAGSRASAVGRRSLLPDFKVGPGLRWFFIFAPGVHIIGCPGGLGHRGSIEPSHRASGLDRELRAIADCGSNSTNTPRACITEHHAHTLMRVSTVLALRVSYVCPPGGGPGTDLRPVPTPGLSARPASLPTPGLRPAAAPVPSLVCCPCSGLPRACSRHGQHRRPCGQEHVPM